MEMFGLAVHCDGCDICLKDYHGHMWPGEVLCESIVYGAKDVVLCKKCSNYEFEEEALAGTNDLPHLLKRYSENKANLFSE